MLNLNRSTIEQANAASQHDAGSALAREAEAVYWEGLSKMQPAEAISERQQAILTARADVESFSIFVPGMEAIGDYPTVEEAETALHYLPFSIRQQAVIVNQDGYCVEC